MFNTNNLTLIPFNTNNLTLIPSKCYNISNCIEWKSLTYLERQKCYGPDKKILFKNKYLTLRSKSNEGHYGMWHTALWSCTHIPNIIDLSRKKQLFYLEVKDQGPMKVIAVRNTPPYVHEPTYQISLTYLERQKCYSPDKKILFKKQ